MPRKGRIDYPGALHHVIIRGINRTRIFDDDKDREEFISRLEAGLTKTGLLCYAWALIPNHAHFLLRTGANPLTALMRSLLTGYAIYFNRRHKRVGYLFQSRYKSILCEEDEYLLQLIRYIHLNPLRAGLIQELGDLNTFPWSGHAVLVGKHEAEWQEVTTVLGRFGKTVRSERKKYIDFVKKGIPVGKRSDLTGGGLVRSLGGWQAVRRMQKGGERFRGDERILGNSDFVLNVLKTAEEKLSKQEKQRLTGWSLEKLLERVAKQYATKIENILRGEKNRSPSQARALFCWWATRELGYTLTKAGDFLNISHQAVSQARKRGEALLGRDNLQL